MADVRLTATNPEDSSVVPVACNAKGELKLEEIPDQSFDGNLDGDLTVSGNVSVGDEKITLQASDGGANFAATVYVGDATPNEEGLVEASYVTRVGTANFFRDNGRGFGAIRINNQGGGDGDYILPANANASIAQVNKDGTSGWWIKPRGDAIFAGGNIVFFPGGSASFYREETQENLNLFKFESDVGGQRNIVAQINVGGGALFAGGKAGFTEDGHLWCTTRRGDTVILDATSNGMGSWQAFDPPSPRDKIEEWAEKNAIRPKPEESSQD